MLSARLPNTSSSPHGELGWFEKQMQDAEQVLQEEQKLATERFLIRQRQILGEALNHTLPQTAAQSRSLAVCEVPPPCQPSRRNHIQIEVQDSLEVADQDSNRPNKDEDKLDNNDSGKIVAKNCLQRWLLPVTSSYTFEILTAIFVVLYSIVLGVQVHMDMTELLGTKSNIAHWISAQAHGVATFLVIAYVIEIVLRLAAEQRDFFWGKNLRWNVFDVIILVISITDQAVAMLPNDDGVFEVFSQFKVLRVLRFFRNLRIITFFKFFTDLRTMLWSVVSCMQSFGWAMVLFAIFFYLVTIFLEDSAMVLLRQMLDKQQSLGKDASKELDENIEVIKSGLVEHWDGLSQGFFSLIFAISGGDDWANIGEPFFRMHILLGCIFTAFVLVSLFGILNVLVGIFVQKAGEIELWDRELALLTTDLHHQSKNDTYKMLFREIDEDRSGCISLQELKRRLAGPDSDKRIQNYFRHLGIDIDTAAHEILVALDSNGDGVLSLDEFVTGCQKLQGVARPAQLEQLVLKIESLERMLLPRSLSRQSTACDP